MRSLIRAVSLPLLLTPLLLFELDARAGTPLHQIDSAPLRWTAIEVVTNDFNSVEKLRGLTGIKPGALLGINDPRLKEACDAIRRQLSAKVVECAPVIGGKVTGYVEAEYIIEISARQPALRPPPHCVPIALAPDLAALSDEWGRVLTKTMADGDADKERVNADQYLDYDSPLRHELTARIHGIVGARAGELEQVSASCTARSRAEAISLMSFTGSPARAIRLATARMSDPDPGVRNAATGLLGTFSDFIPSAAVAGIAKSACATMISGGFNDRSKSLILLNRLRHRRLVTYHGLDAGCQDQIRAIARTSGAVQTGVPARELVESAHPPPRT